MKKLALFCFVLFCFVFKSKSQNLVPNSSFEINTNCTSALLSNALPWCLIQSGGGQSAYFQPCQSNQFFQTPYQYLDACFHSYQAPRTGVAYIDIAIYTQSSTQESSIPQVKLIDTLKAGKTYCVTYYVSLWNNSKYSLDKLGALLTPTPYPCFVAGNPTVAVAGQVTPQVVSTPSVSYEDTFGNEAYLTIGDFFTHAQHYIKNSYPSNCNGLAEYYVDDVSVEVVEIAKAKNDTLIYQGDSVLVGANNSEAALFSWQPSAGLSCTNCPNPKASPNSTTTYTVTKTQCKAVTSDVITVSVSPTGIAEAEALEAGVKLQPNPTNGIITISSRFEMQKIELLNVAGQLLLTQSTTDKTHQLNLTDFTEGIYFVRVVYPNGLSTVKKVVKQ